MSTQPHHVPQGLPPVIPQLVVKDAHAVIEFATQVFDAKLAHTMPGPDGKGVMHGMFQIGGVPIFVSDAGGFASPTQANLFVYVPDVDATVAKASARGGKVLAPVMDMFWGDRWAMVSDPFGNVWQIATHKEDVAPAEMQARMQKMAK